MKIDGMFGDDDGRKNERRGWGWMKIKGKEEWNRWEDMEDRKGWYDKEVRGGRKWR